MNADFPPRVHETDNEILVLEKVAKNLEKQYYNISSILNSIRSKEVSQNNLRVNKPISARSKGTPRHLSKVYSSSPRWPYEDLTEITVTDVITEPSDSYQSFTPVDKMLKMNNRTINPNFTHSILSKDNFILLVPDDSYRTLSKFSSPMIEKETKPTFRKTYQPINFPLLQIDTKPERLYDIPRHEILRDKLSDIFIPQILESNKNNVINTIDLAVSPESILQNKIDKISRQINRKFDKSVETHKRMKEEFIKNNLLHVSDDESVIDFPVFQSEQKGNIKPFRENRDKSTIENIPVEVEVFKEMSIKEPEQNSLADSDVVIHHGYIITSESITDTIPNRNKKSFSERLATKIEKFPTSESDKECVSRIVNYITDLESQKDSEQNNRKSDSERSSKTVLEKESVPVQLQGIPVLPPDMLGNITLHNGNEIKKFLGVKSIDEKGWDDVKDINLNDNIREEKFEKELKLVINSKDRSNPKKVNIDGFTARTLGLNDYQENFKNDVNQSLKEMNDKIQEMDKISSSMEKRFNNSKMISLKHENYNPAKENNTKENIIQKINRLDKPIVLLNNTVDEVTSEFDIPVISESYCPSVSDVLNFSEDSFSNERVYMSQLDLSSIVKDNVRNNHINPRLRKRFSKNLNLHRHHPISQKNRKKFRNEIEKNNYLQRKREARNLALKTLYEIGLPQNTSSEINVKLIEGPTPNEMMLSEIKRNQQVSSSRAKEFLRYNPPVEIYKPKNTKSYLDKVRLQRPEITRKRNLKNPPKNAHQPFQGKTFVVNNNVSRIGPLLHFPSSLTPRSVISQDTDATSVISNWSIPDNVNHILYSESQNDRGKFGDELSQNISIQTNSFIDWDQVSEMIRSPTFK